MTAVVTDYNTMLTDLQTLIQGAALGYGSVTVEKLDLNKGLLHRKSLDIQLMDADDVPRAGNEYIATIRVDLVITAYDLSSYDEAARVRNDLVRATKLLIRENQRFNGDVNSTITGRTRFAQEDVEKGFLAAAVVELTIEAYEGEC